MKDQAIIICRVSTPEQRLSNSLNRQEQSARNLAASLDLDVLEVIAGDASSKVGKNLDRPDLNRAYSLAKGNKLVKYLLFDEVDRLGRSQAENWYWLTRFELELKVKVRFASNPDLSMDTASGGLLLSVDNFKGQGSNEERQQKSINGHVQALREGRYTFPPKPGYAKGTQPGVHIPHKITFKPLQAAFKEVSSGLYSPSEALKRLMATEFSSVYKRWNMDKFRHFATDPYYAGILWVDKQVKAKNEKGLHKPMISIEEHEELVKIFKGTLKLRVAKRHYNPEFPMNKLLLCGDCGAKFTGSKKSNGYSRKQTTYYWKYHCRGCGKSYHRDEVHSRIKDRLAELSLSENQKNQLVKALESVWQVKQKDKISMIEKLECQREILSDTKSKLIREIALEPTLKDEIKAEIDTIKHQMDDLESEINDLRKLNADLSEFIEFGLSYSNEMLEDWWDLDYEERLRCQQMIFPGGISFNSDKKVGTTEISPLYTLRINKKAPEMSSDALMVEHITKSWHRIVQEQIRWKALGIYKSSNDLITSIPGV